MKSLRLEWVAGLALMLVLPFLIRWGFASSEKYYLHLAIQILLWSFIYTSWSLMGRFGLTSLGHGAFTGIGAYVTVLLWNVAGISPLAGIPIAVAVAAVAAVLVGYPCGSLGTQPKRYGDGLSLWAVQFEPDRMLAYYIVLVIWIVGLVVWVMVDRSMDRYALDAASQDEDAAAAVGIDVTREKLKITALSAAMSAFGGAMYGQYQMYIGPDTIAGLGLSLNIVFACIAGGLWTLLGPTFGAVFTQLLTEFLRVGVQSSSTLQSVPGSRALALDTMIYGLLLVLFIIYMPRGILGTLVDRWSRKP